MAYVTPRRNKAEEITSYQVKWRLGGSRKAPQQTERFDDEESAEIFCDAVNAAGQDWPIGWVKGKGYISEDPGEEAFLFRTFAMECIDNRTGIEERYRDDCRRDLAAYILPTFGNCDIRSTDHFCKRTVQQWVNMLAATFVWRGSVRKLMSPKTIKNLHGLLSSILKEAVQHEPPLRDRNPCKVVALPRTDDDGVEDDDGEDINFLEPDEVEGIVSFLARPEDQRLVRFTYATGMRWGEVTALAHRHAVTSQAGHPRIRVTRAWKRNKERGYYLGKPKTKASRRSLRVSPLAWEDLIEQGVKPGSKARQNALIFHSGDGERLPYSTFYDRWMRAVEKAKVAGLVSEWKCPTFHDLRHSHAAVLLSQGRGMEYVKVRLGHESIKTTSDTYGHLLPEADDDAMKVIDDSLRGPLVEDELWDDVPDGERPDEDQQRGRRVHVMHLPDGTVQGWWKVADRDAVAQQWALDRGSDPERETWTVDWWVRQHGNGEKDVRREAAERVQIWAIGPAVYGPDGVLADGGRGDQHEPTVRTVWEWEAGYTEEPALSRVAWREDGVETEVEAWGFSRSDVIREYGNACIIALQICEMNPALAGVRGGTGVDAAEGAGGSG
jgi:integrase